MLGIEFQSGGNMSLSNCARVAIVGLISALFSVSVLGQGLPPGVTPGMLDQLKSMSPAQQQALARQYGISLPDMGQRSDSGSVSYTHLTLPTKA